MDSTPVINLYYPDHWMESIQDEMDYLIGTGRAFPKSFTGLCTGLAMVSPQSFSYAVVRSYINAGLITQFNNVPAWVYTHPTNPNKR